MYEKQCLVMSTVGLPNDAVDARKYLDLPPHCDG